MNILIIHPLGLTYPSYKYIDDLCIQLSSTGNQIAILASHEGQTTLIDGRTPSFAIIEQAFEDGFLSRDVKRQIALFDPDIIHVWNPRATTSRVALETVIATGAKLIVNYEDPEHFHFDTLNGPVKSAHILKHVDKAVLTPNDVETFLSGLNWQWILQNFSKPNSDEFIHPLFFAILNHMASGFTGIWHPWVDLLSSRFRKPTLLMPYSVNFEKIKEPAVDPSIRKKFGITPEATVFLRAGKIYSMVDDQQVMFAGFADHIQTHPSSVLILTGSDDDPNRTRACIEKFHLNPNVIQLGFLKEEEYKALLNIADVVLCPGYPDEYNHYRLAMKIIEYMILGKPMICYASGIGKSLIHGRDALLLDTYSPERVCEHMSTLANDPEQRKLLGRNAYARAREWFDVTVLGQNVLNFYERIMRNEEPKPLSKEPTKHNEYDPNALPKALLKTIPILISHGAQNIALYGAGKHTERLLELTDLSPLSIECIVDDNPQQAKCNKIPVIRPNQIDQYSIDTVLISSDSAEQIMTKRAKDWLPNGAQIVSLYSTSSNQEAK